MALGVARRLHRIPFLLVAFGASAGISVHPASAGDFAQFCPISDFPRVCLSAFESLSDVETLAKQNGWKTKRSYTATYKDSIVLATETYHFYVNRLDFSDTLYFSCGFNMLEMIGYGHTAPCGEDFAAIDSAVPVDARRSNYIESSGNRVRTWLVEDGDWRTFIKVSVDKGAEGRNRFSDLSLTKIRLPATLD